jgi:hypothetical protein
MPHYMPDFTAWFLDIKTSKEVHMDTCPEGLQVITIIKCQLDADLSCFLEFDENIT